MLLSRMAANMYWLGRYLERAEDLSRAVVIHGRMCLDMPAHAAPGFEPLLELCGHDAAQTADLTDEEAIALLLSAAPPHTSVQDCVFKARENLRNCRAVLPKEAWDVLNPTYLALSESRPSNTVGTVLDVLELVTASCQRVAAVLYGSLSRDDAFSFFQMGQHVERADMLLRLVAVAGHEEVDESRPFRDVRFMGLLESLGAYQMYRRAHHGPADPSRTLHFLLKDELFPRSLTFSLRSIERALTPLPDCDELLEHCWSLRQLNPPRTPAEPAEYSRHLSRRISDLSTDIECTYFGQGGN